MNKKILFSIFILTSILSIESAYAYYTYDNGPFRSSISASKVEASYRPDNHNYGSASACNSSRCVKTTASKGKTAYSSANASVSGNKTWYNYWN
jgi:hypothetical protein